MQFLIFCPLAFDIFSNCILISMLTNGTRKIPLRPKFASPQLFLNFGASPKYFSGSKTFYHCDDLCHAICRYRLHQEMNMIIICSNFQKLKLVTFFDFQAYFFENLINIIFKNRPSSISIL